MIDFSQPVILKCALSKKNLPYDILPLRLQIDEKTQLITVDLSAKHQKDAAYIYPSLKNMSLLQKQGADLLSKDYPAFSKADFTDILPKITTIFEKKIHAIIGFSIKSGRCILGTHAIKRCLGFSTKSASILFISANASERTGDDFRRQLMVSEGLVISGFSDEWLKKLTGREKISYLLLTRADSNVAFFKSYQEIMGGSD